MLAIGSLKQRVKMYKNGKFWVIAGLAGTFLMVANINIGTAHADGLPTSTDSTLAVQNNNATSQVTLNSTPTESAVSYQSAPAVMPQTSISVSDPAKVGNDPASHQTAVSASSIASSQQGSEDAVTDIPSVSNVAQDQSHSVTNNTSVSSVAGGTVSNNTSVTSASAAPASTSASGSTASLQQSNPVDSSTFLEQGANTSVNPFKLRSTLNESATIQPQQTSATALRAKPVEFLATTDETIDQWMPNKLLQKVVLRQLNVMGQSLGRKWASVNDISQQDMSLLTDITTQGSTQYIDGKTSYSLEGLQYAKNLITLNLNRQMNNIGSDASPLMTRGDVTDLSPLSGLLNLKSLELNGNRVSDIAPIAGLKNITRLIIPNNNIADLSSLNPAQYTLGFSYINQVIENPVVLIPTTGKYSMTNPVKGPQGVTLIDGGTPSQATASVSIADANNLNKIRLFLNAGTGTINGDKIDYQVTKNQISPANLTISNNQFLLIQNPYTYYMISVFKSADGTQTIATVLTPYEVANNAKDVTVQYQDEAGNSIADSKTLSGLVGDTYTSAALTTVPTGYELKTTPTNATGTFSSAAQTVTYVYKEVKGSFKVHYQNEAGTSIKDDTDESGRLGTDFSVVHPDIDGYTYVSTTGTVTGEYASTMSDVTFVYKQNAKQNESKITVHYKDENGKTLKDDTTSSGQVGSSFNIVYPEIAGYTYQSTTGTVSGTYTTTPADVIFVYRINAVTPPEKPLVPPVNPITPPTTPEIPGTEVTPPVSIPDARPTINTGQTSTVTVHYVTETQQKLAPDVELTGQPGTDYVTEPAANVANIYQLVSVQGNAQGQFDTKNTVVTYVYRVLNVSKSENVLSTSVSAKASAVPASIINKQELVAMPARKDTNHMLPATGEKHATPVVGFTLLTGMLGLLGITRRKRT